MPGVLSAPPAADRPGRWTRAGTLYAALGLGVGALTGVVWWQVVDLPTYTVGSDGGAATSERGLTEFIGGDAWFCVLGAVVGVLLGLLAWRRFRAMGWPVVLLATLTAAASALLCWWVGSELGPEDFEHRLAAAGPGDVVPIALELRAKASLLVWPFFAVLPVLLGSSLGRDDDDRDGGDTGAVEVSDGTVDSAVAGTAETPSVPEGR